MHTGLGAGRRSVKASGQQFRWTFCAWLTLPIARVWGGGARKKTAEQDGPEFKEIRCPSTFNEYYTEKGQN